RSTRDWSSDVCSSDLGNNALLELAQQASSQIAAGGGSLREVDFTNQLAVLSQRIAKNANSLVSSDDIDPEVAFLLGKDTGSFRRSEERRVGREGWSRG